MKRTLLQSVKVIPYSSGAVIDRSAYLSAIFAAAVDGGESLRVSLTHSDTADGAFEPLVDERVAVGGELGGIPVAAGEVVNLDLDLVGCKRYLRLNATLTGAGAAATYALALGDCAANPV